MLSLTVISCPILSVSLFKYLMKVSRMMSPLSFLHQAFPSAIEDFLDLMIKLHPHLSPSSLRWYYKITMNALCHDSDSKHYLLMTSLEFFFYNNCCPSNGAETNVLTPCEYSCTTKEFFPYHTSKFLLYCLCLACLLGTLSSQLSDDTSCLQWCLHLLALNWLQF